MKNYFLKIQLLFFFVHIALGLSSQTLDTSEVHRDAKGKVIFARFKEQKAGKGIQQNDIETLKAILNTSNNDEFRIVRTTGDEIKGFTHKLYQQYYKGIKVDNAEYFVHSNNGSISSINGDFQVINTSITPSITENEAIEVAKNFVHAKKYKWEDVDLERFVKENTKNPEATFYPKGELVISRNYLKSGEKNCLSWKFTISALIPYKEELIYVDAISGEVINQVSLIYDDNATGSAQTQYSGTKAIITNRVNDSDFRLNETRNNVSIQTLNMQRQLSPGSSVPFSDNDNSWTATEYNNQYHDQAALDAHWANEIVLDYWKNIRKRNSINGSGMAILSYVHWDLNYNNAKWDGTNNIILYGDGDGITFRPLVSLDVAAHEFGHGICQYTAGLVNGAVESAAINEGFSDIWGAVIEGWAAPTKQKWFSGEDIVLSSPGYLRSMSNPHDGLEGKVDTYNGTYWYSGTDANTYSHTNLGVLNHWFYLLSEGGTGWNNGLTSHAPVGSGYNWAVGSIGINDAARLAYITEAHYLNSTANYATLRTQSITAAADTFGVNSAQLISATNAWYAVGVGNRFQYASNINVTGNFLICSSGAQYTVNNPPPQTTITWTCSNNIQRVSNQGTNPCTFQSLGGNGSGWIEATLTIGTSVTTLPRKDVWVGRFESTVVTGQAAVCPGNLYTYTAQVPGGHNSNYSYSWTYPSNWIFYTQYDNVLRLQTPLYNPIYGTVRVAITNCWGTSGYSGITVYPGSGCPRYFTIFPNPASDNITITLVDNSESISDTTYHSQNVAESSTQNNFTVRIYNRHGSLISISKRSGTSFTVPLTNMRDGTYVIELSDGKSSSTQTLIVNKK